MRILTYSTLFPNHLNLNFSIFIKHRMAAVSRYDHTELKVVAPVPFFPPIKIGKWYQFSQIKKFEVLDNIETYHPRYIVTPKIGMAFYGLSMFLGSLATVTKIYRRFPFDIIDAHFIYPDGFAAMLLSVYFNKPVVLSARGSDINLYPEFYLIKKLIQFTLHRGSSIISVCSSLRDKMIDLGIPEKKIHVIPNGIDPEKFYRINKPRAKEILRIPKNQKMLLSVGSLLELKGYRILIDAIARIKSNNQLDFVTYIIGEGQDRTILEAKISNLKLENDVFLPGQISNDHLVYWYNAADVFFLGSSREGWPNVVCEALACGTPVVATRVNGIPEIIVSDAYGLLTERHAEDFARTIQLAMKKHWDSDEIHKYGQQRTWHDVAKEVVTLFNQILLNQQRSL